MCAQILGTIGLVLNIIGALVVLRFAFPQPDFGGGTGIELEDNTPMGDGRTAKQHQEDAKGKQSLYRCRAVTGGWAMVLGFVFQLAALWV